MTTASKLLDEARDLHARAAEPDLLVEARAQRLTEAVGKLIEAVAAQAEPDPKPARKAK